MRDEGRRTRVAKDVGDVIGRLIFVQWDLHGSKLEQGEVRDYVLGAVFQIQGDKVPPRYAQLRETTSQRIRLCIEVAVCPTVGTDPQGGTRAVAGNGAPENARKGYLHRRPPRPRRTGNIGKATCMTCYRNSGVDPWPIDNVRP